MLNREACERRVYRLATLLTGNPTAATMVIEQVVGAQPDVRQLDSAHLDRLTVLRSREIPAATLVDNLVEPAVADALASLTAQQREAWVLAQVYKAPLREVARAMDCSATATQRHLELAQAAMQQRLNHPADAAAELLLACSMSLDVPAFYRARKHRRRMARLAAVLVALAVLGLLALAIARWWWARAPVQEGVAASDAAVVS